MTLTELKSAVKELGMPQFTASQIMKWLYQQHVSEIDEMTNISKVNRERLKEQYEVGAMAPIDCQRSKDGTIKYLFPVRSQESGDLWRRSISPIRTEPRSASRVRWAAR